VTFKRSEMIDISTMNHVLSVDVSKRVAVVEPNVPMDKLVNATLKYGLLPPVVPEFPGITLGGAIQGAAAETSSHKYGCVSQTVNWMEYILGDGSVVKASATDHADLFYGSAGSYGSLGLITAAEINLIPAKKYVNITHFQITSFAEGVKLMKLYANDESDFGEGYMFSKDRGAIVIGTMSDEIQGKFRRFSRPQDNWYFLYIKAVAKSGVQITDTLPIKDYLFRFNRGAFWAAEIGFREYGLPFNRFVRFIFDPLLRTRKLYQVVQESGASQSYICQDIMLPEAGMVPFLEFIDEEFNMYPIGGCPIKPEPRSPLQCNGIKTDILFNVGVYGLRVEPYDKFVDASRQIEIKTNQLGGKKWFYSHNYYSEAEFWKIYDKQWYQQLRQKYKATSLPDIYNRTRVKEQYKVSKRRGVLKTVLGMAKLRIVD
jgi:delta24-sterol reductase